MKDLEKKSPAHARKKAKEDGHDILKCGYSALPELLGKIMTRAPTRSDVLDGMLVIRSRGKTGTKKLVCKSDSGPCIVESTSSSFKLSFAGKRSKESKEHCTYVVQAPFPITKSNADIILRRYHAGMWSCHEKGAMDKSFSIQLEARR